MTSKRPAPPAEPARRFTAWLAFVRSESVGGMALVVAAVVALALSNSPAAPAYLQLLALPVGLSVGPARLILPLEGWINEGLMTLFFLVVGLEIRREMMEGQLASLRRVAAPGLAALGGMVVPALIYGAFNLGDGARLHGWAVPVATDIAFVLAALRLLGRRAPAGLTLFLTALAILDDLGAILIIAMFYTDHLDLSAAAAAGLVAAVLYGLSRAGLRAIAAYLLGGAVLWVCVLRSGVHPTLAGVALAFLVPMGEGSDSPAHRLEQGLGGWVTWAVLPLFGLANAGLSLSGVTLGSLGSTVVLGTTLGLLIGKPVGVFGATLMASRLGLARLPAGITRRQLFGGSVLCGIGFTMSLFIGDLSFHDPSIRAELKLAVFMGSLLAAAIGLVVLFIAGRRKERT
jgi:NhaA family Na+:H+ antiporter